MLNAHIPAKINDIDEYPRRHAQRQRIDDTGSMNPVRHIKNGQKYQKRNE